MKQFILAMFLIALLFLIGCQRNTNELPTTNLFFTKTAFAGLNDAVLDAYFTEHILTQPYALSVRFKTRPGVTLSNATILIDYYTDTSSYYSINFPSHYRMPLLTPNTVMQDSIVSTFGTFPLDTSAINVYLLDSGAIGSTYSGYYTGFVSDTFTGHKDTVNVYLVKGFIDISGGTHLFIADQSLFNVTGTFADTAHFVSGKLSSVYATSASYSLNYNVGNYSFSNNKLHFVLTPLTAVNAAGDTISKMTFDLNKQY